MTTAIRLYDSSTIAGLDWPKTPDGDYARRYLLPLITSGVTPYIANVQTDLRVLAVEDQVLPLTVTRYHRQNSYVCSPYNHYIAYGQEEFDKLGSPPLAALLRLILWPLARYFQRSGLDRVVLVNNWLLSTNLYPALSPAQIKDIVPFLADRFPDRPIIFRSIDDCGSPGVAHTLREGGCGMLFSRQVYYQNGQAPGMMRRKQIKVDMSLYRRTPYRLLETVSPADVPRLVQLYNALYLEKYSTFNPQFTPRFFELALARRLLTFRAFARNGRIDGVLGYFCRNGIMTQPIFGYDTALPQQVGLYRLLSMQVLLEGTANNRLINASAGVGHFKRLRGGQPVLEYNAVYNRHLPPARQRSWRLLRQILNRLAVPVIQRYGF